MQAPIEKPRRTTTTARPSRATGSVYLREAGPRQAASWYVAARLPDGRRVNRRIGPAWQTRGRPAAGSFTRRTAEIELEKLLRAADADTLAPAFRPTTGRTLREATDDWLMYVQFDRNARPATLHDYRSVVKLHVLPQLGEDTPLDQITRAVVEDFRSNLLAGQLSRRSCQKVLIVLSGVMKRAVRRGWIDSNPCADVERISVRASGEFNVLTPTEVQAVARAATDSTISACITCAAFTGLRLGELRGLRWQDIDFTKRIVHVRRQVSDLGVGPPKSGKVRSVPLIDQAAQVLDQLSRRDRFTSPEDAVFASVVGSPLPGSILRGGFYDALELAGLGAKREGSRPLVFHDLRHSFGTLAVQAFALSDVKAFMGHADISTTMIYVHHVPRHDAADKLGALVAAASAVPRRESDRVAAHSFLVRRA